MIMKFENPGNRAEFPIYLVAANIQLKSETEGLR